MIPHQPRFLASVARTSTVHPNAQMRKSTPASPPMPVAVLKCFLLRCHLHVLSLLSAQHASAPVRLVHASSSLAEAWISRMLMLGLPLCRHLQSESISLLFLCVRTASVQVTTALQRPTHVHGTPAACVASVPAQGCQQLSLSLLPS